MYNFLGMIVGFAGNFAPRDWAYCDGQQVSSDSEPAYVELVGDSFGGDGVNTAATPNLANFPSTDRLPVRKIINLNGSFLPALYYSTMAMVLEAVAPVRMTQGGLWLECMGQSLEVDSNPPLYSQLQNYYGGRPGETFNLPDLSPDQTLDGNRSFEYLLSAKGSYPGTSLPYAFIGQVQYSATVHPPLGWTICNGTELSISRYSTLFSILGIRYGGDGRTSFALPNIQPIRSSNGAILNPLICVEGIYPPHE